MRDLYRELKQKARVCRNRDVRIKVELICLVIKLGNVSEGCRRMGFSRKFYYRWWRRLEKSKFNLTGLEEKSRRPKRSPNQISKKYEQAILWYARRHYGARMIEALLLREGIAVSRSTICHVLNKRRRPVKSRQNRLKKHRKRYELVIPGQRLQLDVKYVPSFVGARRAYNYVIVDECTRWRFAYAYDQISEGVTVDFLERFKRVCPFPIHTIQTDNGQEFTYALNPIAKHIEHRMDQWCRANNIHHRRIPPGVKELNGKVERSHRIDEQYFYWKAPTESLERFNKHQYRWLAFYNARRPHGGLGYLTPIEKLKECYQSLSQPIGQPALDQLRINFLRRRPIDTLNIDEQLDRLSQELETLIKIAA